MRKTVIASFLMFLGLISGALAQDRHQFVDTANVQWLFSHVNDTGVLVNAGANSFRSEIFDPPYLFTNKDHLLCHDVTIEVSGDTPQMGTLFFDSFCRLLIPLKGRTLAMKSIIKASIDVESGQIVAVTLPWVYDDDEMNHFGPTYEYVGDLINKVIADLVQRKKKSLTQK